MFVTTTIGHGVAPGLFGYIFDFTRNLNTSGPANPHCAIGGGTFSLLQNGVAGVAMARHCSGPIDGHNMWIPFPAYFAFKR
jgi:hypothetical protein